MAFDIYGDSFGDPFMASPNPFMPRRQPLARQTVLPEDESSLLGGMMEKGLGGLAYLGKILDKTFGGRAVRGGIFNGLLGEREWHPSELLSVLPFSDTLGITDEKNVVHGKDLLTDAGVLTRGDDSWENIGAGVAADIALDPAIWLGAAVPRAVLGGLNAVGKPVLQGAGNLTQRATFGAVNPYTAMQKVGDNASRVGSALFDTTVHGAWSKPVQDLSRDVYDPALRAAQQSARNTMVDPLVDLSPYARQVGDEVVGRAGVQAAEGYTADAIGRLTAAGLDPFDAMSVVNTSQKFGDTVRAARQQEIARGIGTPDLLDVPTWMTEANERLVHAPARLANQEAARLQQIANRTGDPADIAAAQAAAANASHLNSLPEVFDTAAAMPYFPRTQAQWADLGPRPASTGSAGGLTAVSGSATQREDFLRGLPGGTEAINDLVRNPAVSGRTRTMQDLAVEDDLLRRMTGFGSGARPAQFAGDDLAWAGARQQAKALSDWLRELPPQAQQAGMFTSDFVGAGFSRLNDSARMLASADAVSEGVVRFAKPIAQLEQEGVRYVRATDMLNNAGLTHVDPVTGKLVAHESVAQSLGLTNVNALRDVAVPLDVAEDMARLGRAYTTPGVLAPVVDAWDKVTNLFKTALTTVFPAFHSRNLMSGLFNQWRDGALSPTALGEAMAVIRGGSITPETAAKVFPGLTAEQATTQLLKEAIANKVAFVRDARQTSDVVGQLASRPGGMLPSQVPEVGGAVRPLSDDVGGFLEGFKGGGPRDTSWRDPLAIAGVKGDVDKFTPVVQGRKLGNTVEDFNRLSHYLSRRSMGDTPEAASMAVRKYQIDYSNATGFEQAVMKRLFPWYSFSRGNLPPLLSDLATKPGKLAATMHVVTGSREPGEFVPPWVAEGAAMALGEGDGTKRFISSFGLPVEDELVKTVGAVAQGDLSRTLQQAFGMAQPFVKLPAELATGTQMYSGRKLEDLRPYEFATLGGLVPQDVARQASQVIANTPLSRFGSTFDKFIDDRKDLGTSLLNTATGLRVTDVEVDKVRERAAQEQLKKLLRGQPGVKTRDEVYVPKDQLQLLSQEDLMTYSLLKEIEARSQKRNRDLAKSQGR